VRFSEYLGTICPRHASKLLGQDNYHSHSLDTHQ